MKLKIRFINIALYFLIVFCMVSVPIRSMAEETYGTVELWDGNVDIYTSHPFVYLNGSFISGYQQDSDSIILDTSRVSYKGVYSSRIDFYDLEPSYVYNGYVVKNFKFKYLYDIPGATLSNAQVSMTSDYVDGISVSIKSVTTDSGAVEFILSVYFNEFIPVRNFFSVPITFDIEFSANFDTGYSPPSYMTLKLDETGDQTGLLYEYSDIRDSIGFQGAEANRDQTILNNLIDGFNNLVSKLGDAATYIGNQIKYYMEMLETSVTSNFNKLTTNLTNWYNGLISNLNMNFDRLLNQNTEEHEETINGFQGSGTDQASDNFDTSAGELHTAETHLTNITNQSVTNYTDFAFNTNVLTTLGASLVYVVTWFTNFWDIGGLFTAVLNIGLALFVAFFILRLRGDP